MKKFISILMALIITMSSLAVLGVSTFAASTPSFGSAPSSVTLYVNDSNNDSRAINIKVSGWQNGYTYKAFSNNSSVAAVENGSVNSKSGVLFTIQAKNLGTATITVQMLKSGKLIQSKTITVKVSSRTQATPSSLKCTASGTNYLKISYSISNKNYINGYWIQVSTDRNFKSNVKSYKVTSKNQMTATLSGLSRRTTYYVRIASMSTLNGCYTISGYRTMIAQTAW